MDSWRAHEGKLLPLRGLGQRTLADAHALMLAPDAPLPPLRGPPTLDDTVRSVLQRGAGGFVAAHDRWVVESRIELSHRSRYEHRMISKVLHLAVVEDGLNVKVLVAFEHLNRRRQLIEEAHKHDPTRPSFENAHIYMGEDDEASGTALSSALRRMWRRSWHGNRHREGEAQSGRSSGGPEARA